MRAVIQKVLSAAVTANGSKAGLIKKGMLVLLGVSERDEPKHAEHLAKKCARLRIFSDVDDKMNLSVQDVSGSVLVVPNFTLCGDTKKGNRPSFADAAGGEKATALYERFVSSLRACGCDVQTGVFGASMQIKMEVDGPVTIWMDSDHMMKG